MAILRLLRVGSMHCLFGAGGWVRVRRLWVSRAMSAAFSLARRPLSACTRRLVLVVSFVFNRAEKRRRCIHLRPSLSSVVSAGTRARVLGGCAVSFLVLLGAIHRAGHTASGLPRSFISAPVTPRGTGAPCTHVSHRIPCSNPIVFDSHTCS